MKVIKKAVYYLCDNYENDHVSPLVWDLLKEEGYISDFEVSNLENNLKSMTVFLKYYQEKAVIELIKRISRPGLRVYKSSKDLTAIPGFGVAILSTSKGVMTHKSAKMQGIGVEVICEVA